MCLGFSDDASCLTFTLMACDAEMNYTLGIKRGTPGGCTWVPQAFLTFACFFPLLLFCNLCLTKALDKCVLWSLVSPSTYKTLCNCWSGENQRTSLKETWQLNATCDSEPDPPAFIGCCWGWVGADWQNLDEVWRLHGSHMPTWMFWWDGVLWLCRRISLVGGNTHESIWKRCQQLSHIWFSNKALFLALELFLYIGDCSKSHSHTHTQFKKEAIKSDTKHGLLGNICWA